MIGETEKSFSLKDLQKFETVSEARTHLIDKKLEETMRGSFEDWIGFFKDKAKLSMGYLEPAKARLVEACQRRNLLVHSGGIINSIYLSKIEESLRDGKKTGQRIIIDRNYLDLRIDLFEKCCLLVAAEAWKKVDAHDEHRAECLNNIAYTHLCEGRFEISESISAFLLGDKRMPESAQLTAQINYWLSKKQQGKYDQIKKEVEESDYSAKEIIFRLARAALRGDSEAFYRMLPDALAGHSLEADHLETFPVFEDMRKDKRYEAYRPKAITVTMGQGQLQADLQSAVVAVAPSQQASEPLRSEGGESSSPGGKAPLATNSAKLKKKRSPSTSKKKVSK